MSKADAGPAVNRHLRRLILAGMLAALVLVCLPAFANADTSSQLTIVGTSDVSDSGLWPNLLQPMFKAAYPQFGTPVYVGSATGAAIKSAEGIGTTAGPSVLVVHAASLENKFVAGGFSYNNAYGTAIFRNDFVLAGPATNDAASADVGANAANNIAQAFADVANAGVNGDAYFVSRGGNSNASGTAVEEHAIWQLVYQEGLLNPSDSSNFVLCAVDATNDGGGMVPIKASAGVAAGAPCPSASPDLGAVASPDNPSWYDISSGTQAPTVEAANTCSFGSSNCYVLTDRGTFDYLTDGGTSAAGTSSQAPNLIPGLKIVTRDNSSSAPGGQYELINYFHAYIINPNAPGEAVNLTAAQDFVNFVTSPSTQAAVNAYLANTTDGDAAPFVADASPTITASSVTQSGTTVTIHGSLTNAEIGYPTLASQPVSVDEVAGGVTVPVPGSTVNTDSSGNYSVTFTPPSTGTYEVVTGDLTQIENASLTPAFGDVLSPAASPGTYITVVPQTTTVTSTSTVSTPTPTPTPATGLITQRTVKAGVDAVLVTGTLSPGAPDANGLVEILARKEGSTGAYRVIGGAALAKGTTTYSVDAPLTAGIWQVESAYIDPGSITSAVSKAAAVKVLNDATTAAFSKLKASKGKVTVTGKLSQVAPATATVELFAVRTSRLSGGQLKAGPFKQVAKVTVKAGKLTFTITGKLTRGYGYSLQLAYVQKGKATTYSKLSSLSVS